MYTIGEFSKLTQVAVKALRFYDEIGLLRPAGVDRRTGYRRYSAIQVERVNQILALKDLGFSLAEIRRLVLEAMSADEVRLSIRLKHDELASRIDREQARLARSAARLALLEQSGAAAANNVAIRTAGAMLVASVRDIIASYDACNALFDELAYYAGSALAGRTRGAVWHRCAEGAIDCEVFVVLPERIGARDRMRVREIGPQRVASLVYRGDRDYLDAYRAIRTWLVASGVEVVGPKREIFLDDGCGEEKGESVTEIQFPIDLAAA